MTKVTSYKDESHRLIQILHFYVTMLIELRIKVTLIIFYQLISGLTQCSKKSKQVKSFDYRKEYSNELLSSVYSQYLSTKSVNQNCNRNGKVSNIMNKDIYCALDKSAKQLSAVKRIDQDILATNSRAKLFDANLYEINNQAKLNEFATKNLVKDACLCQLDSVIGLKNISYSNKLGNCQSDSDVNPTVKCDPKYKYRRIDGKCNNLVNTNWGSNFHCQRRLIPPDYSDGIGRIRLSTDGSPLPCPRLLSKQLFNERASDSKYTALQTMWGQLIAHDTFNRVVNFGGELDCCQKDGPNRHPECLPILTIPRDNLSIAYKQNCINFIRALTCNTCKLGARSHINHVTSFLDLSQIYGLTDELSHNLRTFQNVTASDGSQILPEVELPDDQDKIDLSECKPINEMTLHTCFKNGDGIRGNQNPAATALVVLMVRRHNQHCKGLANVNPEWTDEKLFQEARRLLISEFNRIVFGEYLPTILGKHFMKKFDLKLKKNGFTKYHPNVDPGGIQAVGGAALRFGHLTTRGVFQVSLGETQDSYKLRDKFMEMSDIWNGRTNGIIRGLTEMPAKEIRPNIDDDLQDHLFFDKNKPRISDLVSFNILRGRDYGLPSYVHYIQYLKGIQIKNWNDLTKFIPAKRVNKLKTLYKNYKDIDLYVGGVLENGIKTFKKLLGIQFFHLKFGDRFYFEHSGQSGSFTLNQLNEIRNTVSLANFLCKTTDFQSIPLKPFSVSSELNPKVFCKDLKDLNYELFH